MHRKKYLQMRRKLLAQQKQQLGFQSDSSRLGLNRLQSLDLEQWVQGLDRQAQV